MNLPLFALSDDPGPSFAALVHRVAPDGPMGAKELAVQRSLAELGYRVAYQEAPAAGIGVVEYDPHGAASSEIQALIAEIELMLGLSSEEAHHVA